mmetsp:Transcript_50952/g.110746  ORF Transcript_50952/g.110746 Transcript_50952/m.110746 type:complete len:212 (-) Transcript_50952:115-750(-)
MWLWVEVSTNEVGCTRPVHPAAMVSTRHVAPGGWDVVTKTSFATPRAEGTDPANTTIVSPTACGESPSRRPHGAALVTRRHARVCDALAPITELHTDAKPLGNASREAPRTEIAPPRGIGAIVGCFVQCNIGGVAVSLGTGALQTSLRGRWALQPSPPINQNRPDAMTTPGEALAVQGERDVTWSQRMATAESVGWRVPRHTSLSKEHPLC